MTAVRSTRRRSACRGDNGFTLLETVVSISIVGVVMSATSAFFVNAGSIARRQQTQEVAARIAADAISQTRSIKGSALTAGRDKASSQAQWAAATPAVAAYLADSVTAWDTTAVAGAGSSAALPTVAQTVTVDRLPYAQSWYVGQCWLPSAGGSCGPTQGIGGIPMDRVVVAVTWTDNTCLPTCSYVTSTLVSNQPSEPVFNLN